MPASVTPNEEPSHRPRIKNPHTAISDTEGTRTLALSFWNSREDAERYHREHFPAIKEMIRHLLEGEPVIRTFNVESSTAPQNHRRQSRLNSSCEDHQ